ncbi:MAG: hypothetical protein RBS39_07155 [Phycisphaerales bacterium]|jgi:3-methyladenine DNA glycosylase/8-oxoguanine DNA glycosylase|nr:hypothetical protein [Phycisphaerales bacterium]
MGTRLTINVPEDFVLARDACSYGYFLLAPNEWDVPTQTHRCTLGLSEGPARVTIAQGGSGETLDMSRWASVAGTALRIACSRALSKPEQREVREKVSRMLRLDEDAAHLAEFHELDPRWKASGRGRLFRSPTLFEDVVKTVTSCNVQWPGTIAMNERLCAVLGTSAGKDVENAFPTQDKLARARATTLRARCRVGYRDARLIELAKMFRAGEIDEAWLTDPANSDERVMKFLVSLPGVGPYAAANILQLLGRYTRLPLDTESVRHGRAVLGFDGTDASVMNQVHAHFSPFGQHSFRSYWFEMWAFYEAKRGPSHTWERRTTGRTFTASQLK